MPKWKWEGLDKEGKKSRGAIEALSQREARKLLRAQGLRPKRIIAPSILEFDFNEWMIEKGIAGSFGAKELTNFTKQLSTMINAGVPIMQSLEILYKAEKHVTLKRSIKKISTDVGEGKTVAEAMSSQKGFDKLYCNLVKAGEAGGILDTILDKLAVHMDKSEKTKTQIKSAMTYPGIVCVIGFGVVYGLMVFIVPKFQEMITSTGQEMPWITQTVIDISNFLQSNTLIILPLIFITLAALSAWIKTPVGKYVFDRMMMKMPIFGGIVIKGNLSQFTRTLSTMLSAGVSLIDSLDICIETLSNGVIQRDVTAVRKAVTEGKSFTEPIMKIDYFPDMVSQMIRVGEQTGNLDQMLIKVADVFEEEVNVLISNMTKMIEPLIIVVLGSIVATILVAMYLPIFMAGGGT
jgi:type IV pilus assembly protein PilC